MKSILKKRTARGEAGLTLLEVLAATMIFAMVMTVLIGTSSTAVHHVGLSARRLEASLLADDILAGLEIQMKQGIAPEIDENESTRDQYTIRIFRTELVQDPGAGASDGAETSVAAMLGAKLPEVAKHLKQYDIEVSWFERNGPQRVTRTSFAFDWEMAAIEFSDLFQRNGRNGGGGFGGGDGSGGTPGGGGFRSTDGTPGGGGFRSTDGTRGGGGFRSTGGTRGGGGFGSAGGAGDPGTGRTRRHGHNARLDSIAE